MNLAERLEAARAEVAHLERLAASATCSELGHDMKSIGGCSAGCYRDCCCSVPVNECTRCGDCDYGDNAEADEVRRTCLLKREIYEEDNDRDDRAEAGR
jgi:hypothetical protein